MKRGWGWMAAMLIGATALSCATTRLDATWSNPEFAGAKLSGRVLVVGLTRDETLRRQYEDEVAARLIERGQSATRSYEVTEKLAVRDGAPLLGAARRAGATAILSSAVVAQEHVQRVVTEPLPAWSWGYHGWYDHYWSIAYTRTEVRSYERYIVSTSLTDVASGKITWTARSSTDSTDRVEREVKALAAAIVDALAAAGRL